MSEVKYAIAILKEKLANADQHNLAYQRLSIADMEAIWGALEKSDKSYAELKAQRDALAADREKFAVQCAAAKIAVQYAQAAGFECTLDTPAVDAYLNSVRAEGVEMFAEWLRDQAITFDAHGRHGWADKNRVAADAAKRMSAQLRAGAPKGDSE